MGSPGDVEHAGSHLSEVEALMWTVDRDPVLSATFGSITLLDRAPNMDRMARRMERAMAAVPRLRQHIVDSLNPFTTPQWCDDPDVDVVYHLQQVTLDPPGSMDDLHEFAATLIAEPFDRNRPLWRFWVVDGLSGGGAALVLKMHHTITDGVGGVRLWEQFIDFERHGTNADAFVHDEAELGGPGSSGGGSSNDHGGAVSSAPPSTPVLWGAVSAVGATAAAVGTTARRGADLAQRSTAAVVDLARHPSRVTQLPVRSVEATQSTLRQVVVTDGPCSPLWADRSMARAVRTLDFDLDATRAAAHRLGGTVNDLFVTVVAGAAGEYHRRRGVKVTDLRMAMPVSVRHDHVVGGNAFVPTRMLVPAGEPDARRRFNLIHETLTTIRRQPALGLGGLVATVANLLPAMVTVRLARQQVRSVDFTTSNLRASPVKLYIGGARMESTYPVGPLGGTAFNASMLSYAGDINLGIHIDRGAIDDPDLLVECLHDEFARLLEYAELD